MAKYNNTFKGKEAKLEKSEYAQDEPLAAEAKRIIDEIALVGWTSGGHSAGYVPVFAIGAGADLFQGRIDNTEIPIKIAKQPVIQLNNPITRKLDREIIFSGLSR